ncbi:TonB-dependent siderophore receptor [Azospirillum sp. 412522]|nr:TonB-dependent siderophore receptor [Azospirillum sp. 412522]
MESLKLIACIACAAIASTSATTAQAEDNPPGTSGAALELAPITLIGKGAATDGYQPKRTSLATGTDTPLLDVPQAVSVVAAPVLKDQAARTLDEALANVSGVTQGNTLGGTQDAFMKRGFGDNRDGSTMRDGLRTAMPRSFTAGADRVEVLKGPASMLYGILDPGGLVNVVSKTPELTQRGEAQAWGSSFGGGGGQLDVTGPLGAGSNLAYRFVGDIQDTAYWRNFGRVRQKTVAPSLAWYGEDTTVTLGYEYTRYQVPFDRGTIFDTATGKAVPVSRRERFDEPYNVTSGFTHLARIGISHKIDSDWSVSANYAYSHNWYKDDQARVTAYNARTGVLTRRADATQDSNVDVHAVRADLNGKVTFAGLRHQLLFGASYDYSDTLRTDLIRGPTSNTFNIYRPVYGRLPISRNVVATDSDQTERLETSSVYAQDSIELGDRWIVLGGLRYQYYDQYAGRGRPFRANTDVQDGKLVPRAGVVYKVTPDASVYASWSQSFRPNSSISSYLGALPPEEGDAYEVGAKVELARGLTATAALFDLRKRNVLYSEVVNGLTVNRTAGSVRSRGFELDVAGEVAPGWSVIGSYSLLDAQVTKDPLYQGNRLANVARSTASLFVTHDLGPVLGSNALRIGGGARYAGKRAGDAANSFYLPSYVVADAFAAYDTDVHGTPVSFQVNVKNIFDKTYYTSAVNNLGVAIGEPLQAVFQTRVSF